MVKRLCKALAVAICLLVAFERADAAPVRQFDELVSESSKARHYLDTQSLRTEGAFVRMWIRVDFKELQTNRQGQTYSYEDNSFAVKCNERTFAMTSSVEFDSRNQVVRSVATQQSDWQFHEAPPGSFSDIYIDRVCPKATSQQKRESTTATVSIDKDDEREWILFPESTKFSGNTSFEAVVGQLLVKALPSETGKEPVQSLVYRFAGDCAASTLKMMFYKTLNSDVKVIKEHTPTKEEATPRRWPADTVAARILELVCEPRGFKIATEPNPARRESSTASSGKRGSSGSGFAVSPSGYILTNDHVVDGCNDVRVTSQLVRGAKGQVIARDDRNDLALIKVNLSTSSFAQFRSEPIRAGDSIVALGYPLRGLLASDVNVSTGTVSALAGLLNDTSKLQVQAPVQPGNSGGPLLDLSGALAGVVVEKLNALAVAKATGDIPQNVNFAVKSEVAVLFLRSSGVDPKMAGQSTSRLDAATAAARGKPFTYLVECNN